MKKVLIVGGAGYVGGCMADLFADSGYDVTVYDNLLYELRFLKPVKFINGDIRDTKKLGGIINLFDCVVWLAAIVGDGACQVNESLTKELNFDCVKWLADSYNGKILFTSTCSVYGMNNNLIDEESDTNPLSLYAETKLLAEKYILQNSKDPIIFRLGTLHGVGDAHSRIRLDLVVNILTKRAVEGQKLCVFGGEQWRPLLHVKDVANAFKYCLENNISGVFNLSERNYKIFEIAEQIKLVIPNSIIEYRDIKFEDLRDYKANNLKILNCGWKPELSIIDGIKDIENVISNGRLVNSNDPIYSNVDYLKREWKTYDY